MPRRQTHLPLEQVNAWFNAFPGCASFLHGYRVHLLLDEVDTAQALLRPFPLRLLRPLLRKKLRQRQAAVAIELYFHRAQPRGLALAGGHNPILERLGVTPAQSEEYASALRGYLATPSFRSAVEAFTHLGILEDARVEQYAAEYRRLQASPALRSLLMWSVKRAHLEAVARELLAT